VSVTVALPKTQGESRYIDGDSSIALIDYFEIYFRRHDWATHGPEASMRDTVTNVLEADEIFYGSATLGSGSLVLSIPATPAGIRYDVLLLGGKKIPGGHILLASAYTSDGTEPAGPDSLAGSDGNAAEGTVNNNNYGVLIKTGRRNTVTLPLVSYLDVVIDVADTIGGYSGFKRTTDALEADSSTRPALTVTGFKPLNDAGFVYANDAAWLDASGKGYVRAMGTRALSNWSGDKLVSEPLDNLQTYSSASETAGINTTNGIPLTDELGMVGTFARVYAQGIVNPFGQTHKGSKWTLQSGLDFYKLQTNDGAGHLGPGGAVILQLGDDADVDFSDIEGVDTETEIVVPVTG
jgi:hypothetical protein